MRTGWMSNRSRRADPGPAVRRGSVACYRWCWSWEHSCTSWGRSALGRSISWPQRVRSSPRPLECARLQQRSRPVSGAMAGCTARRCAPARKRTSSSVIVPAPRWTAMAMVYRAKGGLADVPSHTGRRMNSVDHSTPTERLSCARCTRVRRSRQLAYTCGLPILRRSHA